MNLDERAHRARTSLRAATQSRPVPPMPTQRPARVLPGWAPPALAAMAVVALVLGISWSGLRTSPVVVTPGAVTSVPAGQAPVATVTDGSTIWVADAGRGSVLAFQAKTLRPLWTASVGARPVALAYGLGALWVLDGDGGRLLKLSASTGRQVASGRTSLGPTAVDVAFGSVWVLSAGNQTLDQYDGTTVTQTASAVVGAGRALTHSSSALWVSVPDGLRRVLPSGGLPLLAVPLRGGPRQLAAEGGRRLWAALDDRSIVALDGTTGAALGQPSAVSAQLTALTAVGEDALAATADGTIHRFTDIGASGELVTTTGTPVDALAAHGSLLVGTARSTALLYVTKALR